jgi:predicted nucleotidyltransferase
MIRKNKSERNFSFPTHEKTWSTVESKMAIDQIKIHQYAQKIVLTHPLLKKNKDKLAVVLAGSRSVGYNVPSSDYDFLVVCDEDIFGEIALLAGKEPGSIGIDLPLDQDKIKMDFGVEVDLAVYRLNQVAKAFNNYKDVVLWIWTNAVVVVDPMKHVSTLQQSFTGYPRDVLEEKLKKHFLNDFHLSVHGITYRYESQNIFSVVHAIASKVAEFCRLCCLLDNKPFPYEKWLLEECKRTTTGQQIFPFLEQAITCITHLGGDLEQKSADVKKALYALDMKACSIVEETLVSWGIERNWIESAYADVPNVIYK